ncbi:unnamed protein product [Allacma fusca]|uniref:Proteasomal ATPase-associated factor 1 n=1 Tax=Allacma fusca TaxID=39272 RepID=A0A8J2M9U2_9HEXA|nr:unnamed protein product [Allacma fusca]
MSNRGQNLSPSSKTAFMSTMSPTELSVPFFGIQCNWDEVLKRNKGKVWASVRRQGESVSSHATLISGDSENSINNVSSTESFLVPKVSNSRHITLQDPMSHYECSFIAPVAVYDSIHKKSVISLDVTEGGLGVSVCGSNQLKVWETDTGTVRRTLEGHVADIYTCRFFPSGVVILSAGADLCIKIWSAENGQNPVTLKGHRGPILDTCVVDRGRNILSVSKDGTARLWDCGMSTTLATLAECNSAINSCCLIAPSSVDLGLHSTPMSDREIGTSGKLLLLAREDGKVQGVGLGSRESIFLAPVPSPANSIISTGANSFAVGCQGGQIATFDLRKIVPPKHINSVTPTPILSLMSHPRSPASKPSSDESERFFWAAKSDGSVVLVNPSGNARKIVQLTGSDHDPIYSVKHDGTYVFTACRDGCIRKYAINHVTQLCS